MGGTFFRAFFAVLIFVFAKGFLFSISFFEARAFFVSKNADFFHSIRSGIVESQKSKKFAFFTVRDDEFLKQNVLERFDFSFKIPKMSFPQIDSNEEIGKIEDDGDFLEAIAFISALDDKDESGILGGEEDEYGEKMISFLDSRGEIRRFSYGEEQSSFSVSADGENVILVSVYKERVKRRSFDSKKRLLSTEIFSLASDSRSLLLSSSRTYFYNENGETAGPIKSIEEKGKTRIETCFSPSALPILIEEFVLGDEGEKTAVKKRERKYDEDGRTIFDERTTFLDGESEKIRYEYTFTQTSEEPDFRFFENDVLRQNRAYTAEKNWTETTFFDNGFSVVALYEDGIKIEESVLFGEMEVRHRIFSEESSSSKKMTEDGGMNELFTDDDSVKAPPFPKPF